ncbi:MAG: thioredoxin fold domain-containing protein [Thermoplasmatota archaeon]
MDNKITLVIAFLILTTSAITIFHPDGTASAQDSIEWYSYEEGVQKAEDEKKPIFIDFWRSQPECPPCDRMEEEVYPDPDVIEKSKGFVCIKVNTYEQPGIAQDYGLSVVPTLYFTTPQEEVILKKEGYRSPSQLVSDMDKALQDYEVLYSREIDWMTYDDGRSQASKTDKMMMVYFHEDGNPDCTRMLDQTFEDPQVISKSSDFVNIRANRSDRPELVSKYDINEFPTILFLTPDDEVISDLSGITGFVNQDQLFVYMEEVSKAYDETQSGGDSSDGSDNNSPGFSLPLAVIALTSTLVIYHRKRRSD